MNIFQILQKKSKLFFFLLVLLGAINSALYSGILIFVNNIITQTPLPFFPEYDWAIFIGLLAVSLVSSKYFQTYMVKMTNEIVLDFELTILDRLRFATYEAYDKLGGQRVYTAINDTKVLGQVPESIINLINSLLVVACGLGYLFWIAPVGGVGVLVLMAGLLVLYLAANRSIEKDLNKVRDLQNDYHRYLRDLLHGFKEIKMSIARNDNMYHKYLKKHLETSYHLGVSTSVRHLNNELTGSYSWYVVLGLILFVLPRLFDLSMAETTTFVVTVLYLMGPIAALIGTVPFYTRVKIALERIQGLERDLDVHVKNAGDHGDRTDINKNFTSITFSDVVYEYYDKEKKDTFTLGPINAEIREGEIVFITGGNGSGKSTFINLLTGLIRPTSGVISLNGFPITSRNYSYYSDQISAIFTNNHIFNENYDAFDLRTTNASLVEQIRMMQLQQVLKVDDGLNKIDNRLSKGQQKRLALIYAMQEKRQVIVLDEWAAEQDPAFRSYFYNTVLAELKKAGKTVIAVTHDDAYFHCADRVIKFNYGKIESDTGALVLESQLNAAAR